MAPVCRLEIKDYEFAYEIPEKGISGTSMQVDFLIDGEPLGKMLGIWPARPWFGRTNFDNKQLVEERVIEEFLALRTAKNQLETNRFVLFGCHCGDDSCGIISCEISRDANHIFWKMIRHEEDESMYEKLDILCFDYAQYEEALWKFLALSAP